MANVFAPNGFAVAGRLDGAAWTGNQSAYVILPTNTHKFYTGDVCTGLSTGYSAVAGGPGGQVIDLATPGGGPVQGIFNGCAYLSTAFGRINITSQFPGSDTTSNVTAQLIDDPQVVFVVQSGNGGPVTPAQVGLNIGFQVGTGNALNGQSGAFADFATIAATATLPFRIVGLVNDPPGANGADPTTPYNNILVAFNAQAFKQLTGI
jgi:hypothetical protein